MGTRIGSCWQTQRFWYQEHILEVEYVHYPGEDWGGFGWRVPPSIEIREVRVVEGPTQTFESTSELEQHIHDEFHR